MDKFRRNCLIISLVCFAIAGLCILGIVNEASAADKIHAVYVTVELDPVIQAEGIVPNDENTFLVSNSTCASRCARNYDSCISSCKGYYGYSLPAGHMQQCRNQCMQRYQICLNTCN